MTNRMRRILVFVMFMLLGQTLWAQRTQKYEDPAAALNYGKELMEREKFAAAKQVFEGIMRSEFPMLDLNQKGFLLRESQYYSAVAAVELRQPDADYRLLQFIEQYPEDLRQDQARFYLGRYYFESKRYRDVIKTLSVTLPDYFSTAQAAAFHYYLGYSYFTRDSFALAKTSFLEISELKNEYHYPANYYLGFIAYQNAENESALQYFQRLIDSKHYNRIVPYFITKLYFEMAAYDQLLTYALPLAGNREVKNQQGINYLIAQAYIRQAEYIKAIPYMNRYLELAGGGSANDYYQLGFAQYQARDYKAAIPNLSKSSNRKDTIGQNASYLLGDCYLKTDQKEKALTSFYTASKLNFDADLQELAAFNHAKLGYELNIHPQSLSWLREFLANYPQSAYADELRTLLGDLLLSTKNFKEAVLVIESIKERNLAINKSYQKVTYFRGIELFNQGVYHESVQLFDKSLTQAIDKNLTAQAYFWKGEALYKLNNLKAAIGELQRFVQSWPATSGLGPENSLITAHYTLGYAWFKQNDYLSAIANFEKSYQQIRTADSKVQMNPFIAAMYGDLLLRLADAHFAVNSYADAATFYQQVIDRKMPGSDYAQFQLAILSGLQQKTEQKISGLKKLIASYANSLYYDRSLLELANTYFIQENTQLAAQTLDKLIKEKPNSLLLKNAFLIKGLMFFNDEKYDDAIVQYKRVVEGYPKTQEARDALNGIKNIYILQNNVDAFFAYAASVPNAGVSVNVQDSITFQAAELVYNQGNCEKALLELSKYLTRFPDGYFAIHARFARADCYQKSGKTDFMEQDLQFVVAQSQNIFTERAHAQLAAFYQQKQDWSKALPHWQKLENNSASRWNLRDALLGQLRAHTAMGDSANMRVYANKVNEFAFATEQDKLEAQTTLAVLSYKAGDLSQALLQFTAIYEANKGAFGAQAKFYLAQIQLDREEYAAAQATVFELVDKIPYYDEWIARAFIVLAETYVRQNDLFQAKATLQSIIDNREEDEITQQASRRLSEIEAMDKKTAMPLPQENNQSGEGEINED